MSLRHATINFLENNTCLYGQFLMVILQHKQLHRLQMINYIAKLVIFVNFIHNHNIDNNIEDGIVSESIHKSIKRLL